MKITLSWLKEHLETEASLNEITDKLTMLGLEVENVLERSKGLGKLRCGTCSGSQQAFGCRQATSLPGR